MTARVPLALSRPLRQSRLIKSSSMASSNFGSLFGGGGSGAPSAPQQQQQQQQQSASIFSPNNQTSIFGNTSTTQAAPTNSVFGSQSQAQPQPGQSSVFGQSQAQPALSSSQTTQPAFFNSLLERGKKRPLSAVGQNSSFEELPSLQLGLDDIRRKARELGSGGPKDSQHGLNTKA